MVDKPAPDATTDAAAAPPVPPKRSPGHRGAEVKDTVAEMAAKAHEISLEAGSKMAAAMKDVINAAAGITGFVLESARDLVQYMVRRGQMTQEEADKLIRQAEEAQVNRPKTAPAKGIEKMPAASASPLAVEEASEEASAVESDAQSDAKAAAKKSTDKAADPGDKPAAKKTTTKSSTAKKATTKKK